MEKLILKNELGHTYYTCEFDRNNHWIYNNWFGQISDEELKAAANSCLDMMERTHCPHLLNDVRLLKCPWNEASQWIIEDWAPRALQAGIRNFAHIILPTMPSPAWVVALEESTALSIHIFHTSQQGQEWLKARMPRPSIDEYMLRQESGYIPLINAAVKRVPGLVN